MSRTAAAPKNLPPSHPAEQHPEHRAFLIRSLERNDKEIAALIELNQSLHAVKRSIVERCGELTLLDLGQGKIQLAPNEDRLLDDDDHDGSSSSCTTHLDSHSKELCVEFLLRMKLRHKLLNRLFRRLNRVASAMDGNDVSPPAPPRYGDLRLHIDPSQVQAF
jgi:hypothetical protein